MKYYSEKLDRLFDSMEELIAEETPKKKSKKSNKCISEAIKESETPDVPTRKELAADVEAADEAVKKAYAEYEQAKINAEELSKKYLDELNNILEPAQKVIKDAETRRYEAIRKFNDSYGAYQVTYTGARAADEMVKAINNINSRANTLFRDFLWL